MILSGNMDEAASSAASRSGDDDPGKAAEELLADIHIRYLCLNDASRYERDSWLHKTFTDYSEYNYSEGDTSFLSAASQDYDVLIVGGNDSRRIARLVRTNEAILRNRLKISLVSGSNAQRRSQLLLAGFDDVFDIDKIAPPEAIARVAAMWQRYELKFAQEKSRKAEREKLNEISYLDRLTPRERAVLEALAEARGTFSSYKSLRQAASNYYEDITFDNLKVIICNLRKKLRPGVQIVARPLQGYELTRSPVLVAAEQA